MEPSGFLFSHPDATIYLFSVGRSHVSAALSHVLIRLTANESKGKIRS